MQLVKDPGYFHLVVHPSAMPLEELSPFHHQLRKEKDLRSFYGPNLGGAHMTSAHVHGHTCLQRESGKGSRCAQQRKEHGFGKTHGNLCSVYFSFFHLLPPS